MGKKDTEPLEEAKKILAKLMADSKANPFNSPVLWEEWDLLDYPKIVKEPMDLGTIKTNLEKNKYKNLKEFRKDVELVWKNCKAYNEENSDLCKAANKLDKKFQREMGKLENKLGNDSGSSSSSSSSSTSSSSSSSSANTSAAGSSSKEPTRGGGKPSSVEEKAAFCKLIYELNEINLGKLVQKIDEICEKALSKRNEDDIEINVDALDPTSFRKLQILVKSMVVESRDGTANPAEATTESTTASNSNSKPKEKENEKENEKEKEKEKEKKEVEEKQTNENDKQEKQPTENEKNGQDTESLKTSSAAAESKANGDNVDGSKKDDDSKKMELEKDKKDEGKEGKEGEEGEKKSDDSSETKNENNKRPNNNGSLEAESDEQAAKKQKLDESQA